MKSIIVIFIILISLVGCSSSDNDTTEEFAAGLADEKMKKSSNKIVRGAGKIGIVSATVSAINKVEKQKFEQEMSRTMDLVLKQLKLESKLQSFLNKTAKFHKKTISSLQIYSNDDINGNLNKIKTGYIKINNNHLKFDKNVLFEFLRAQTYLNKNNCNKSIKSIGITSDYLSEIMISKYCKETQTKFNWSYGPNENKGITIIYNKVAYKLKLQ